MVANYAWRVENGIFMDGIVMHWRSRRQLNIMKK